MRDLQTERVNIPSPEQLISSKVLLSDKLHKSHSCHREEKNMIKVPVVSACNLVCDVNADVSKFLQIFQSSFDLKIKD